MTIASGLGRALKLLGVGSGANIPESEAQLAIRRGDAARNQVEWRVAATEYRAALAEEDGLSHIWVQLGHALKEQGDLMGALQAYQKAVILTPEEMETHVHLAHVYKRLAHFDLAISHLLSALHFGLESSAEERELLELLTREVEKGHFAQIEALVDDLDQLPSNAEEAPFLRKLRAVLGRSESEEGDEARASDDGPAMVFDISDLIGFWRSARLPTGIQRVQIEVIESALERKDSTRIRLSCFVDGRDDWLEVPVCEFCELAALARTGGEKDEKEWVAARAQLNVLLSLTRPFVLPIGAMLINLGTSWWLRNYFLFVRHAKQTRHIRYIPFVHDMIPIMAPQHCTRVLTQDFISWALGVFDHADHFLVNSEATRSDLLKVAGILGYSIKPANIAVIPLDSDFRKVDDIELAADGLDKWHLADANFVLFVSTVESRKGHLLAFEAWSKLIESFGADNVPQLVCVGNRGWLNDQVYERLACDHALSRKVTMLSGLSDRELALLYRTCRFTIYPSLYEGWGLPVTESLCYGKVPLVSDTSSLPEAGGPFAAYFAAGSVDDFEREATQLIFEDSYREELERHIAADFRPRTWSDVAKQILDRLDRFVGQGTRDFSEPHISDPAPAAHIGFWHPLAHNCTTRIWHGMSVGEKYRSNLGWFWPEERGCRVKTAGGELTMRIAGPHGPLRMMISLYGDEHEQSSYSIACGACRQEGIIDPNEALWIWLDIAGSDEAHDLRIDFLAYAYPEGIFPTYFVRGFYLREAEDDVSRRDFLEAVTFNRLDMLDAFSERNNQPAVAGCVEFDGFGKGLVDEPQN